MSEKKVKQTMDSLEKALSNLEEALLVESPSAIVRDGTIKRFELVIELFWKAFKRLLAQESIYTNTPKESFKQAYYVGWIKNEEAWLQLIEDRNLSTHTYNEENANHIIDNLKKNVPALRETFEILKKHFK